MTKSFHRIKNFNVSVKELDKKVIFMRKLVEGGSEHSFGIHVAKMAGMPTQIITKANIILKTLEKSHQKDDHKKAITTEIEDSDLQLSFFKLDDPILEQIREEIKLLDIDTLTPVEALMKLNEIKNLCKK
jgi:DNA mismatch repair protein MutS